MARDSETRNAASPLAVVDLAFLDRQTLGDPAFRREIVGLVLRETPVQLGRLASARSWSDWRITLHTLKGSARAIGMQKLAAAAAGAERLTEQSDGDARAAALGQIRRAFADAEAVLRPLLAG